MRIRTTFFLLLLVAVLGALYMHYEYRVVARKQRALEAMQLLHMRPERVDYLMLESEGVQVACGRDGDSWNLIAPLRARANVGEIERILSILSRLPRGEIITQEDLTKSHLTQADYGLEHARTRVTWEEAGIRKTLYIGKRATLGHAVYGKMEGISDIISIDESILSFFPVSVTNLRDRVLFHGDPGSVQRVEILRPGGFLQLVATDEGGWRIQQPVNARADRTMVQGLIDALFELRIVEFVADNVSDSALYGVNETPVSVTVWNEREETGQTLLLGAPSATRPDLVHARRATGSSVFTVSAHILDKLKIPVHDVRDRVLIPLRPDDIDQIRIESTNGLVHLSRESGGSWQILAPGRAPADAQRVRALMDQWVGMRIIGFVDDGVTNGITPGFVGEPRRITFSRSLPDAPRLETGTARRSRKEVVVTLGDTLSNETQLAVKIEGESGIYLIPATALSGYRVDALDFRQRQIFDLNPADVRRLRLVRGETVQTVERDEIGHFTAIFDKKRKPDLPAIQAVLGHLNPLVTMAFVASNPTNIAQYGLQPAHVELRIGLTGEFGIGQVLLFGDTNPEGKVYARTLGRDVVFLLDAEVAAALQHDLYEAPTTPSVTSSPVNAPPP